MTIEQPQTAPTTTHHSPMVIGLLALLLVLVAGSAVNNELNARQAHRDATAICDPTAGRDGQECRSDARLVDADPYMTDADIAEATRNDLDQACEDTPSLDFCP